MNHLNTVALRRIKPNGQLQQHTDGRGLYLRVTSAGKMAWRIEYRFGGARRSKTLGLYPDMSLAEARRERDDIKNAAARGNDPEPAEIRIPASAGGPTFGEIAEEYLSEVMVGECRTEKTIYKNRRHLTHYARPLLSKPIREIGPAEILRLCKTIEAERKHDTAHRTKAAIGKVFRYAIQTERAEIDPTQPLARALMPLVHRPHPAIVDEREFGPLFAGCANYDGGFTVRAGLQLMILCVPRPVELRLAKRQDMMGVEQSQLLTAVHGAERIVDMMNDPLWRLSERATLEIDHGSAHGDQLPHARQVLQAAGRRLGGERVTRRECILGHLEHRDRAQAVRIVAVLIAGGDHPHAKADHVGQAVNDMARRARVVDALGQSLGDTKPSLHLRQRDHAAVGRHQVAVKAGHDALDRLLRLDGRRRHARGSRRRLLRYTSMLLGDRLFFSR